MISMEKLCGRLKHRYIDCKHVNLDKLIPIYVKPLKKFKKRKQA